MQRLPLTILLAIALFLSACSDDSTSPDNNGSGGNGKGFAIISVDKDTVLWEDTVTVTLRNASTNSFTVFIHTVPIAIDSVRRDSQGNTELSFRVPAESSTGLIRVYERTTVQATGTPLLSIVPRRRSTVTPMVLYVDPDNGYTGDLVLLDGIDLQFVKEMHLLIGEKELSILRRDSMSVLARITPDVTSGLCTVSLDGRVFDLGMFTKLEHTEERINAPNFQRFWIYQYALTGTSRVQNLSDSTILDIPGISPLVLDLPFDPTQVQYVGDSLFLVVDQVSQGNPTQVEVRLKLEKDNRVSGIVRARAEYGNLQWWETECEVHNMHWKRTSTDYEFYSRADDLITTLSKCKQRFYAAGQIQEVTSYTGGGTTSRFEMKLQ